MELDLGADAIALMRRIKDAIDPNGIMNPRQSLSRPRRRDAFTSNDSGKAAQDRRHEIVLQQERSAEGGLRDKEACRARHSAPSASAYGHIHVRSTAGISAILSS